MSAFETQPSFGDIIKMYTYKSDVVAQYREIDGDEVIVRKVKSNGRQFFSKTSRISIRDIHSWRFATEGYDFSPALD
jgi:hypothetical protein